MRHVWRKKAAATLKPSEGAAVACYDACWNFASLPWTRRVEGGQKGYRWWSLIFFPELPHVTRLPPDTSAVGLSWPTRSQDVKLVELTRSDREMLHVWPGCLSQFGALLVVWGRCWKLLESWTKPSIQRLRVSCRGNPSIEHDETWALRMWWLLATPTEVSLTSRARTENLPSAYHLE